jgi:hypothetical protein
VVSQGKGGYVSGVIHIQTIDGYWLQLKRQIIGIHHWVSSKHLDRYVAESSWRYNWRGTVEGARVNVLMAYATAG